jgi:peroxiredoxin
VNPSGPDRQAEGPVSPHVDRLGHPAPAIVPEGEHNDLGELDRFGEHGRIGYGRLGRYTPFLLALAIIAVLVAIGIHQTRPDDDDRPVVTPPPSSLIGQPAPGFTLATFDGGSVDLASLRGSVVFLNLWASWCDPCVEEMPDFNTLNGTTTASGTPIAVIGLGASADRDEPALALARELGVTYPAGRDTAPGGDQTRGPIQVAYGLVDYVMPSTVVITPDGTIAAVYYGPLDPDAMQDLAEEAAG